MKVLFCFFFLFLVSFCSAKTLWHQLDGYTFSDYVREFKKNYGPEEYGIRKQIFEENLNKIRQHNQDSTKTWRQGVNHFTDHKKEELKQVLGMRKELLEPVTKREIKYVSNIDLKQLPKSMDWRDKGIISPVKDQGRCGSCWTFGTAETIESYWAQATGQLTALSEQQILDCTPNPKHCGGTGGCFGGTAELAMQRIIEMGGITTEWMYPYISYFGASESCHFNSSETKPFAKLGGYHLLPSNEQEPILKHLATQGPLAINVDASSWHFYESGVFDGCNQTNPDIDHVVQLVGYGTDSQLGDYWLVRNSWSPTWGEKGYIRLRRETTPRCGTDVHPQDGVVCEGGPTEVKVCGTCGVVYRAIYPIVKIN